jgi:hypothetical protein
MKHFPQHALDARLLAEELLTEEEVVFEIASKVRRRGDHGRVAHQLGISQGALSNILTAGRSIGPRVAAALGYRRVIRFEKIS